MMEKTYKGLSAWQLTMMALGTVIGGSFFLGSSVAIRTAGPSVLITYITGGILVYFILFALSEMTVANPDAGSFRTYAAVAFGQGTGFVVGWVYWLGMVLGMSSEATAASILIQQWFPDISVPFLSSLIILAVTLLNLLGADKLSKLESGLAGIKVLAVVSFILASFLLMTGAFFGASRTGTGIPRTNAFLSEPFMPGGVKGIAGGLLVIMFAYAGFEIIGLASTEADNPRKTVPRAIAYTVISLTGLYILSVFAILMLIPTAEIGQNVSPMVAVLNRRGIGWAGTVLNMVLITAILSTMLAAMFGLGRMIRSLEGKGHAPRWLKDEKEVPHRGILFSGISMLSALGFGFLFPSAYLFLISSGGFAILFTYAVIIATQIRLRKKIGCPPEGKCQMPGYPYASWIVLFVIVVAMLSMPFIPGQTSGMFAGMSMVLLFTVIYAGMKFRRRNSSADARRSEFLDGRHRVGFSAEISKELDSSALKQEKKNQERKNQERKNRHEDDPQ